MIEEMRLYHFRPGALEEYLPLAVRGLAIRGTGLGTLTGFWLTRTDGQDIAVHLWRYDSLDHRQRVREALLVHPEWNSDFIGRILPLLDRQEVRFLSPAGGGFHPERTGLHYVTGTFEARPGRASALLDSLQHAVGADGDACLYAGISPWPNSITVFARGDAARRLDGMDNGVTSREWLPLRPASFSPLQ